MNKKATEEVSLEFVNKQVAEMKKKIQLLEGQRKAHYEMWDTEKKQNAEKIKQLKKNIKQMYSELSKQTVVSKNLKICDKIALKRGRDEALESLDLKVIEARKKLDLLQHEVNQRQQRIVELSTAQSSRAGSFNASRWILPNSNLVSSLENQIHEIEINIMEVEHLRKKYRSIKTQLMDESVDFESTLTKLEEKINRQANEITNVQKTYEEVTRLRKITDETLIEEEKKLAEAQRAREIEMEELKSRVESYTRKMDFDRLERHPGPAKGEQQDSQSEVDSEEVEGNQEGEHMEKIFTTLKEATGVNQNEDVITRFSSQRDTKIILEKMKSMSENEKAQLIKRKEKITAELEAHKFTEIKNQESTEEELEAIQCEIQKETENYEQMKNEYENLQQQIKEIMEQIHTFCLKMKDIDAANVPEKCPPAKKCDWLLKLFRTKVESAVRRDKKGLEKKEKGKNVELWSALPFSFDSKVSDIEDEEEIPTRNSLKREAQLIYGARSRRRGYRSSMGKQF